MEETARVETRADYHLSKHPRERVHVQNIDVVVDRENGPKILFCGVSPNSPIEVLMKAQKQREARVARINHLIKEYGFWVSLSGKEKRVWQESAAVEAHLWKIVEELERLDGWGSDRELFARPSMILEREEVKPIVVTR